MLASLLFPYDDDARELIESWLSELVDEGCILRYLIGSDHYIEITKWLIHQKIDKPSASKIPPSIEGSPITRESSRNVVVGSRIKDQGRDQGEDHIYCAELQAASPPDVVEDAVITISRNDNTEHPITDQQVLDWSALYPAVDVMQALRSIKGWAIANPKKRKTKSGMLKFINAWLSREQDKGPRNETNRSISSISRADREYGATLATVEYERAIDF